MEVQKILDAIQNKWDDQIEKIRIEEVNGVPLLIVEDEDEDLSCIGTVISYKTWPGMAELKGRLKAMESAVKSLGSDEDDDNQLADLDFHDYIFEGVFFVVENNPNELLRYRRQDEFEDDADSNALTGSPILELVCRMK